MTVMKGLRVEMIALADLLPNPHRRIERYTYNEEKIERLLQSFKNSRFWDGSIQGGRVPHGRARLKSRTAITGWKRLAERDCRKSGLSLKTGLKPKCCG